MHPVNDDDRIGEACVSRKVFAIWAYRSALFSAAEVEAVNNLIDVAAISDR
jgi:hypothetical protein